jgi:hypothetical protein
MNRLARSLAIAATLAGCASDPKTTPAQKTSIGTATAGDLTVELLTDTKLETGMTPVYLRVKTASGQPVTDATVSFMPMMAMMGGTGHSAPVVGAPAPGDDGLYHCDVVFQMASSAMGSWSAIVDVTRPGSATVEASFASLVVADSGRAKTFSYTDPATSAVTKYVSSLNFEAAPRVGLNPVVVTLHRMQDMMTFVPVDDAAIVIDPQMPSMGHGSPGSVNPTLASPGLYDGQLSFSMAGDWVTTVTFSRSGVIIGTPTFATTF